ncbi:hypothetical protein Sjap_011545 [Stephania japonica]|uniref:Uncharacterized protein n=1 Tax=Stephania japonica TaxID=461633 RepID=A0AAP0JDN4_9MAGN
MLLFPTRAYPSLLHLHQSLIFSNSCHKSKSPFLSPPPPLISSPSNSSKILYSKPNRIKHIKAKKPQNNIQTSELDQEEEEEEEEEYVDEEEYEEEEGDEEGFSSSNTGFRGRGEERDYDKDPEFGEILGGFIDDPQKAHARVESRLRKKRSKVLHTKTGSGTPMKVRFNNRFSFSNSYIWFEFYKAPLPSNISLICDAIRSWHIIGRLGGCNSMNMQLSQAPVDRRPNYDAIQGANVTPTTFYNIGDFEIQENLGRVWVDIGTGETLLLDILVNALTQISSDYVGIKQVVFGGSEFESWNENLTSEDTGCSTHKI